jgi:hypothetical protein
LGHCSEMTNLFDSRVFQDYNVAKKDKSKN